MNKLPVFSRWMVQSLANPLNDRISSRLDPEVVLFEFAAQVAEDSSLVIPAQQITFQLSGDPIDGMVQLSGQVVDDIRRVNDFLLSEVIAARGLTRYADLPQAIKDVVKDPSIPERLAPQQPAPREGVVPTSRRPGNQKVLAVSHAIAPPLNEKKRPVLKFLKKVFLSPYTYVALGAVGLGFLIFFLLK